MTYIDRHELQVDGSCKCGEFSVPLTNPDYVNEAYDHFFVTTTAEAAAHYAHKARTYFAIAMVSAVIFVGLVLTWHARVH